ncbi:WD40-repeat-containing domain protein [Syncephalis fuscata]|nr:WD40-repeat-containing domain protein [Syncephalis fuscata]
MSQSANTADVTRRSSSPSSPRRRRRRNSSNTTFRSAEQKGPFAFSTAAAVAASPADSAESSDESDQRQIAEARAILACTDSTSANELPSSLQLSSSSSTHDRDLANVQLTAPLLNSHPVSSDLIGEKNTNTTTGSNSFETKGTETVDKRPLSPMSSKTVVRAVTKTATAAASPKKSTADREMLKLPEPQSTSVLSYIVRPFTTMLAASASVFFWHPLSVVSMIGPQRMRLLAQRRLPSTQAEDDNQIGPNSLYDGFRYAHRRAARVALDGKDGDSDSNDEFLDDDTVDFKEQRRRVKEALGDVERRIASLERRRDRLLDRLENLDDDDTPPATASVVASEPGLPRGLPMDQLQGHSLSSSEDARSSAKTTRRRQRTSSETVPTCRHTLTGHDGIVTCIDLDFTTGRVVSGSSDRTVRVWDGNIGECEHILSDHSGSIYCLQLEGEQLITGSQDRTIRQWDLSKLNAKNERSSHRRSRRGTKETDTTQLETEEQEDTEAVAADNANANDTEEQMANDNVADGKSHRRHRKNKIIQDTLLAEEPANDSCLVNTLTGHTDAVTCLHFDANCLVSGSADRTLRQWDLATGTCVLHMDAWWAAHGARPPPSNAYASSSDSFVGALQFWQYALCSGTADGIIRMWDLRTGQTHRTLSGHAGPVNCLQFDQRSVVSGGQDGTIKIWDLRTGEVFDTVNFERPVTSLQFDDAKVLCTAGDSEVKIYHRANFQRSAFRAHREPVSCVRFAGRRVVTGGNDDVVKVWRT